ncbi:MAG TPA: hypothetical protein VMV46_08105 [Thermoanaerobaculia bacterium]|nr:hypothetical protein [Thermoanaerobaculia bacterium]
MEQHQHRTKSPGLDDETLAALVDGELEGEERARALEAVARDPDAWRVLVETAAFVAEHSAAESRRESAGVVDRATRAHDVRRGRSLRGWTASGVGLVAAALLLMVIAPIVAPPPGAAVLAERMDLAAGSRVAELVPRSQSLGFRSALSPEDRAARLGALVVDLELARRLGDGAALRAAASGLRELASGLGLGAAHDQLLADAERGGLPAEEALGELENALRRQVPRRAFDAGRTLEAVRLATALGNDDFAELRAIRRQLRRAEGYRLPDAGPLGWRPGSEHWPADELGDASPSRG